MGQSLLSITLLRKREKTGREGRERQEGKDRDGGRERMCDKRKE